MNEDCCLPDIVAKIYGYLGDPLLASSFLWLIGRLGKNTAQVSSRELGRVMRVSHPTAGKVIEAIKNLGLVKVNSLERSLERSLEGRFQTYTLSICYEKILKNFNLESLLERQVENPPKKYQEESPCDVAAVLPIQRPSEFTDADLAVGRAWLEWALSVMPWKQAPKSWSFETFAKHLRKIREKTDLNDIGIAALLEFIKSDDFWSRNALSPAGLLAQSANGNRKIDNILLRMRPKENKTTTALRQWASAETVMADGVPF